MLLSNIGERLTRYEEGLLPRDDQRLLFADLIVSGYIRELQGFYQREAMRLLRDPGFVELCRSRQNESGKESS